MAAKNKYIIDKNKCLGRGATADVYLGIKLDDGIQCALKCSKYQLKKEISILRDLDHQNIVKYYDSLIKYEDFEQVIVMEYCNRGSLYEFIDLHQGLCDNLFLRMLECLHNGIHYMRSKVLVHRDIKPGNMMVHEDSMGFFHIKIGDMGTAKKVEDDQTFLSLVGTEEYLHPEMYIRYLEGCHTQHKASVDLWSIGVTLYHAAATELPFMPYNYSRNSVPARKILKYMYENKKPGIISGRQNTNDRNDITWSDSLPDKCRLTKNLKLLSSKLIGILMDTSDSNTYDRFFEEAMKILQKKRVLMFNSLTGELQLLYIDNLTYNNIMEEIAKLIKCPREDFVILTRQKRLDAMAEVQGGECLQSLSVKGHLTYELTDNTVLVMMTKMPPESASLYSPSREVIGNCESPHSKFVGKEIMKYSEKLMKSIYQVSKSANYIDCQIDCYQAIVKSFNENIMIDQLRLMNESLPWQMKAIRDTCLMTDSLVTITSNAITNSDSGTGNYESLLKCKSEIEQLRQKAGEGEKCGEQYYFKIVERREMIKYSMRMFDNFDKTYSDPLTSLVHLAEQLVNEVRLMPDDRSNIEDIYKLEIWQRHISQFKFYQSAKERYAGKEKNVKYMHLSFNSWMKQALSVMERVLMLRDFLKRQEERRISLRTKFIQVNEFLERILSSLNINHNITNIPTLTVSDNEQIKPAIIEIKELTEKVKKAFYKET